MGERKISHSSKISKSEIKSTADSDLYDIARGVDPSCACTQARVLVLTHFSCASGMDEGTLRKDTSIFNRRCSDPSGLRSH